MTARVAHSPREIPMDAPSYVDILFRLPVPKTPVADDTDPRLQASGAALLSTSEDSPELLIGSAPNQLSRPAQKTKYPRQFQSSFTITAAISSGHCRSDDGARCAARRVYGGAHRGNRSQADATISIEYQTKHDGRYGKQTWTNGWPNAV